MIVVADSSPFVVLVVTAHRELLFSGWPGDGPT